MAAFKLAAFSGAAPRISKNLLKDTEAQDAVNVRLDNGELKAWNKVGALTPEKKISGSSNVKTMFYTETDKWFLSNANWDIFEVPIEQKDTYMVILNEADGLGTYMTYQSLAETGWNTNTSQFPINYNRLFCPPPSGALSVSSSSGSGTQETRTYIHSYVADFNGVELESGVSPASTLVTGYVNGTWALGDAAPPAQTYEYAPGISFSPLAGQVVFNNYRISKIRIYRSVASDNNREFLFVKDVDLTGGVGAVSVDVMALGNDTVEAASLGEVCPSLNWTIPTNNDTNMMNQMVVMANGVIAGFHDTTILFSEPYQPQAYPVSYRLKVDSNIIGIASFGSSLVIGTNSNPYIATGIDPSAMTLEKLPMTEPCASRKSMVSDVDGVMYASPNGIVKVGLGGAQNISRNIFSKKQWADFNPSSMIGVLAEGRYYLFYDNTAAGGEKGGLIFDSFNQQSPYSRISQDANAVFFDKPNSVLYLGIDLDVKDWDKSNPDSTTYEWKSKQFETPYPVNLGSAIADVEYADIEFANNQIALTAQLIAANQAIFTAGTDLEGEINDHQINAFSFNGSILEDVPAAYDTPFVLLKVFGDGVLRGSTYFTSAIPQRLPAGYKADKFEFVLSGNVPMRSIRIAENIKQLKQI